MKKILAFGTFLIISLLTLASFPNVISANIEKTHILPDRIQEIKENIELTVTHPELQFIFGILIELIAIIWGTIFLFILVVILGINPHG